MLHVTICRLLIACFDSEGIIIWDRVVGGNGNDQSFNACPTSDGGVVALGYTTSSDGDISNYYGFWDSWIIKLNSDGSTDWDFTIGTSFLEVGRVVIQTSDGGFLIGNEACPDSIGNVTCVPHSWKGEAILFKLDKNGQEEWQHCYGGSGHEGILELIEVDDGFLFVGYTESNDGDVSGLHGTPLDSRYDIWIVKIDFLGDIIWQKCYGGSNDEYSNRIFQTSDGDFMVFGTTQSYNGDVNGNPSLLKESPSIWVFKIDSIGELLWQQCIGGVSTEDLRFGVFKNGDNSYVIAGDMTYGPSNDVRCSNNGIGDGSRDFWVFEVLESNISINETTEPGTHKIYPNPANSILNIDLTPNINIQNTEIEILDIYGKVIFRLKPDSYSYNIDISLLASGLFFIRISDDNMIYTEKFLKM